MASPQHDICAICLEQPKHPRSLPTCTHLFCDKCLANYVKRHKSQESVACPTCTIACPIQTLKDAVAKGEAAGTGDQLTENKLCTLCSYKNVDSKAEFTCANCDSMYLCLDCTSLHKKNSYFKHHVIKSMALHVSYKPRLCQRHGGRLMKLLCLDCDQTICEVCASVEHTDHDLGDICDLMKQVLDATEPLATARSEIYKVQLELNVIENKQEGVILAVTNHVELLKKDLDKRRDELISAVKRQSGIKHIGEEAFTLLGQLEEALELGQGVLSSDIAAKHQYEFALNIRDKVLKAGTDTNEAVVTVRDMLQNASVPKFTAAKDCDITVGNLELMHTGSTGVVGKAYVRLETGHKSVIHPCYKVGNVGFYSRAKDGMDPLRLEITILASSSLDRRLNNSYAAKDEKLFKSYAWQTEWSAVGHTYIGLGQTYIGPKDFIVNNNGTLTYFSNGRRLVPQTVYHAASLKVVPEVYVFDNNTTVISQNHIASLENFEAIAFTETKVGLYLVLSMCDSSQDKPLMLSIIKPDLSLLVHGVALPKELTALDRASLKMCCVKSLDMILFYDSKMLTLLAFTLKVKPDTSQLSAGSLGRPQHYLEVQHAIRPPLEGHIIIDVCCSANAVYVCTKLGDRIAAGQIRLYEVTFRDGSWEYADVTLLDSAGKEYDTLAENEMLRLGTHKDMLMCMVYSPFTPAQQMESNEPGMNVSWWFGKLP